MKSRFYMILIALLLAAVFLLFPKARRVTEGPGEDLPPETAQPVTESGADAEPAAGIRGNGGPRLPTMAEIKATAEPAPQTDAERQIDQQESMVRALQKYIDAGEARLQKATNDVERQTIRREIEILSNELELKRTELEGLRQSKTQ